MNALKDLLDEYDRLGDARFSTAHDFVLRQRHLENWAAKARRAIAELVQRDAPPSLQTPKPATSDRRRPLERART
jgi:hypothetical protein